MTFKHVFRMVLRQCIFGAYLKFAKIMPSHLRSKGKSKSSLSYYHSAKRMKKRYENRLPTMYNAKVTLNTYIILCHQIKLKFVLS